MDSYCDYEATRLRRYAIFVTSTSLITTLILTVVSATISILSKSASITAFAANSAIDLISCILVFWRYYDPNVYLMTDHQHSLKEKKTCIVLGYLFIISGLAVIGKAVFDLVSHSITTKIDELMLLSSVAIFFCVLLSGLKFWLYSEILSSSIYHDAISSVINLLFAILIVFSSEMIKINSKYWFLDPAGSCVLAMLMIIYGIYVIISTNTYHSESNKKATWTYTSLN